jgi:hypothetical protein
MMAHRRLATTKSTQRPGQQGHSKDLDLVVVEIVSKVGCRFDCADGLVGSISP